MGSDLLFVLDLDLLHRISSSMRFDQICYTVQINKISLRSILNPFKVDKKNWKKKQSFLPTFTNYDYIELLQEQ